MAKDYVRLAELVYEELGELQNQVEDRDVAYAAHFFREMLYRFLYDYEKDKKAITRMRLDSLFDEAYGEEEVGIVNLYRKIREEFENGEM